MTILAFSDVRVGGVAGVCGTPQPRIADGPQISGRMASLAGQAPLEPFPILGCGVPQTPATPPQAPATRYEISNT